MRYADGRWAEGRWDRKPGHQFVVGHLSFNASGANQVIAQLWNPHTLRSLWVLEVVFSLQNIGTAAHDIRLIRTSARGATGGTGIVITPDLDNDFEREITPDTGAVLELASFTTQPTLSGPEFARTSFASGTPDVGSMTQWLVPKGIRVPPETGLALAISLTANINGSAYYRFTE